MDQELLPIRSRGQSVKARIPLSYLLKIQDELCKNAGCTDLIFFRKLTSRFQKWNMFSGDIDAICKDKRTFDAFIKYLTETLKIKRTSDSKKTNTNTFIMSLLKLSVFLEVSIEELLRDFKLVAEDIDPAGCFIEIEVLTLTDFAFGYKQYMLGYILGIMTPHWLLITESGISIQDESVKMRLPFDPKLSFSEIMGQFGLDLTTDTDENPFVTPADLARRIVESYFGKFLTPELVPKIYTTFKRDKKLSMPSKPMWEIFEELFRIVKIRFPSEMDSYSFSLQLTHENGVQIIPVFGIFDCTPTDYGGVLFKDGIPFEIKREKTTGADAVKSPPEFSRSMTMLNTELFRLLESVRKNRKELDSELLDFFKLFNKSFLESFICARVHQIVSDISEIQTKTECMKLYPVDPKSIHSVKGVKGGEINGFAKVMKGLGDSKTQSSIPVDLMKLIEEIKDKPWEEAIDEVTRFVNFRREQWDEFHDSQWELQSGGNEFNHGPSKVHFSGSTPPIFMGWTDLETKKNPIFMDKSSGELLIDANGISTLLPIM